MIKCLDFSKLSDEAFDSFINNSFPYYVKVIQSESDDYFRIECSESIFDSIPKFVFFSYKVFDDFLLCPELW